VVGLNFTHAWMTFLGSVAILAVVLMALVLMLGLVKLTHTPKYIGAMLGLIVAVILPRRPS
jgi:hypothetical protein